MADFKQFLHAILEHWVVLMSGGISVAFAIWEKLQKNKPVATRVFFSIGAICVFYACFLAWQVEHHKVQEARIDLRGEIFDYATGDTVDNTVATIFLRVVVKCAGTPSSATRWRLVVFSPWETNGTKARTVHDIEQDKTVVFRGYDGSTNRLLSFLANECFQGKFGDSRIEHGDRRTGWVGFALDGVRAGELVKGTRFQLSFEDVLGTNYICDGGTIMSTLKLPP